LLKQVVVKLPDEIANSVEVRVRLNVRRTAGNRVIVKISPELIAMSTQPENQKDVQDKIEQRIRTMRTLWMALFFSIVLYYALTFFMKASERPNSMLSLTLLVAGIATTLASFLIKHKLLTRATEQQQVPMVQQGYVVAWAVTEVAAMMGLLDFFLTGNRYYYVLFIVAACGQLLHFPRREHLINASFKSLRF
jgi:hypothetical protein